MPTYTNRPPDDDESGDDDATQIYRPYVSPADAAGPGAPPADPFAPPADPFTPPSPGGGSAPPDPFAAPDPFAPQAAGRATQTPQDPFAPDQFAPPARTLPDPFAPDAFAPRPSPPAPSAPDPFAPAPQAPPGPFAPAASVASAPPDPFAPATPAAPAPPDPFAPVRPTASASSDPFAQATQAAQTPPDPFTPATPAAPAPPDPFAPATPAAPAPQTAPDPFAPDPYAAQSARPDPFAPSPRPPDPFAADPFAPLPQPPDPFQADPFAPAASAAPPAPHTPDPFADAPWPPPSVPAPSAPAPDPFQSASRDPFQSQRSTFDSGMSDPLDLGPRREAPRASVPAPVVSAGSGRLADAFASVFALILQLRSSADFGDPGGLRERAEALLDRAVAQAGAQGAPASDVREAEFCLVAFLDETLLMSDWPGRDGWAQRPLQLSRYERYDAGEAFFDRLRQLLSEGGRDETLEVYYLCIALGYKGRYQIHGREVLGQLVTDLKGRLARAPGGTSPLAPHALPSGPAAVAEAGGIPTWALFAGAAALVLVLYLVLSFSVSGIARDVARDVSDLPVSGSAPAPSR